MDYEKILKDALNSKATPSEVLSWIEEQFPALVESEDEKAVKNIIESLNTLISRIEDDAAAPNAKAFLIEEIEKQIAWLEKQGEQKPIDLVAILKDYFANTPKEQQEKDWAELKHLNDIGFDAEIAFGAKDSELIEAIYNIPDGYHAEIIGDKVVIKKGEKKPTEWSEEDENIYNAILDTIYNNLGLCSIHREWFKNIKERLKYLRPQNRWKPSKNQIMALRWILNNIPYCKHKEEISGLLEQLEQL